MGSVALVSTAVRRGQRSLTRRGPTSIGATRSTIRVPERSTHARWSSPETVCSTVSARRGFRSSSLANRTSPMRAPPAFTRRVRRRRSRWVPGSSAPCVMSRTAFRAATSTRSTRVSARSRTGSRSEHASATRRLSGLSASHVVNREAASSSPAARSAWSRAGLARRASQRKRPAVNWNPNVAVKTSSSWWASSNTTSSWGWSGWSRSMPLRATSTA